MRNDTVRITAKMPSTRWIWGQVEAEDAVGQVHRGEGGEYDLHRHHEAEDADPPERWPVEDVAVPRIERRVTEPPQIDAHPRQEAGK